MEQTRARAVARLNELNKVVYNQPIAMDLRGRNPMLQRVDRRVQMKNKESFEEQKKVLKDEIKRIDNYMESMRLRAEHLERRIAHERKVAMERKAYEIRILGGSLEPIPQVSLFTETAPIALSKPNVQICPMAIQGRTRLKRYMQRRMNR